MPVETGILNTKLYRPRISGELVPRPRLLERLDGRRERPLTLVSAPAGYGKTTLANSWLDARDCPSAWVSLDEGDDDLVLFLTYLLAAVETMFPGAVAETQALLEAASLPPLPVLSRSLINELDRIERAFILVLDGVHHIHNIAVHDLLNELLAHPPRPMHLVLISRKDPPLNLARLRARRQVTEVRTHDLRFTREETAAFVQQETGAPLDDSTVGALLQRVEGWVTGLRLITLSLRHRGSVDFGPARLQGSASYVAEYLVTEVLESQPQAVQDYLLTTAILDRFCAPLCEAVQVGPNGAETKGRELSGQAFVEWLEDNNPFLVRLDDQGEWYRYHHLFRDLLRSRLEQRRGPDGIAALHRRASPWFARNGLIDEALHHALAAGETAAAVELVNQHRHNLLNRERWQHLERWLRLFDRPTIEQSPALSITEAWVLNHHAQIQDESVALDRTERLLAETDPPPEVADPIRGELYLLRANLLSWFQRSSEALTLAEQARSLLPQGWHYAHSAVSMVEGIAYAQIGKADVAEQSLLAGLRAFQSGDGLRARGLVLYSLCFLKWTTLNLQELKLSSTRYRNHGQLLNMSETEGVGQYYLGCAHYHLNEMGEAEKCFRAAANSPYKVNRLYYALSVCGLAFIYQASGRPGEARELLKEGQSELQDHPSPLTLGPLQAAQAQVAVAQGDLAGATRWAEAYDPMPIFGVQEFHFPQLTFVRVLLAQNTATSLKRAAELLAQLVELARNNHYKSALLHILPAQALWNDIQGDGDAALAILEEAVHLGEAEGLVRAFVDAGPQIADLLVRLSQRGVAPDYVAQILAAFQTKDGGRRTKTQDASSALRPSSELVDPLTHRELEVLALLVQGLSNKEIAAQLVITKGTVKQHTHHIYQKLGVKNRWQAASKATDLGILSSETGGGVRRPQMPGDP